MNGRQRLINAISRAAKQAHLLSGYHRDRARSKTVQIARGVFISSKGGILFGQEFRNFSVDRIVSWEVGQIDSRIPDLSGWMEINSETR